MNISKRGLKQLLIALMLATCAALWLSGCIIVPDGDHDRGWHHGGDWDHDHGDHR